MGLELNSREPRKMTQHSKLLNFQFALKCCAHGNICKIENSIISFEGQREGWGAEHKANATSPYKLHSI